MEWRNRFKNVGSLSVNVVFLVVTWKDRPQMSTMSWFLHSSCAVWAGLVVFWVLFAIEFSNCAKKEKEKKVGFLRWPSMWRRTQYQSQYQGQIQIHHSTTKLISQTESSYVLKVKKLHNSLKQPCCENIPGVSIYDINEPTRTVRHHQEYSREYATKRGTPRPHFVEVVHTPMS